MGPLPHTHGNPHGASSLILWANPHKPKSIEGSGPLRPSVEFVCSLAPSLIPCEPSLSQPMGPLATGQGEGRGTQGRQPVGGASGHGEGEGSSGGEGSPRGDSLLMPLPRSSSDLMGPTQPCAALLEAERTCEDTLSSQHTCCDIGYVHVRCTCLWMCLVFCVSVAMMSDSSCQHRPQQRSHTVMPVSQCPSVHAHAHAHAPTRAKHTVHVCVHSACTHAIPRLTHLDQVTFYSLRRWQR